VLENAAVAPFVAAATFIGSMDNIPLATVLKTNGVIFAGIIGFIYSDLMVPPLAMVNAKCYGSRVALYIAAVMYVSIVLTALAIHYSFAVLGTTPESRCRVTDVAQFALDYTFYMNVVFAPVAVLIWLHKRHAREVHGGMDHAMRDGIWNETNHCLAVFCGIGHRLGIVFLDKWTRQVRGMPMSLKAVGRDKCVRGRTSPGQSGVAQQNQQSAGGGWRRPSFCFAARSLTQPKAGPLSAGWPTTMGASCSAGS